MQRLAASAAGVLLLVAAAVAAVVVSTSGAPASTTVPGTHFTSAALDRVVAVPTPRYSRTMASATTLSHVAARLDDCAGPVAVDLGPRWPTLVAEHDYCGGSAWISRLTEGQSVDLSGRGVDAGLYVVRAIVLQTRGEAQVKDLPQGDVVLQTCVGTDRIVLVALDKFVEPDTAA